jgi:hypothetical protein
MTNPVAEIAQESYVGLRDPSFYSGVVGIAVGGILGTVMTLIPFYKAGTMGNVLRTVATTGAGAWLVMESRNMRDDLRPLYLSAGTVLGFIGLSQVAGYITANTGISIPGFNGLGSVLTGKQAENYNSESSLLPQRGSGRVLGQETATQDFSDIYNADTFEEGTYQMVHRVPADDPVDSVVEEAPLGHGVTQWFGADGVSPTGGVAQSFGGVAESSSINHNPQTNVSNYVSSVDTMGVRAMNVNKGSEYTQSVYGKGYEPPVNYSAEEPTVEVGKPAAVPMAGSMPDIWSAYVKPSTSAEEMIMDTARMINPGQPIQWYGAETATTGTLTHHVTQSEGFGSVVGQ